MGDSLTIFTIPRAFVGKVAERQRNAVTSWVLSGYGVLLLGDDPGVIEFADEMGVDVLPDIARNEWGTPLVSDAFGKAQTALRGELAAFVNTDVMLDETLGKAVALAAARFARFLVVGCRYDVTLGAFDFTGDWRAALHSRIAPRDMHGQHGLDFFGFRAPLWDSIPPFGVGRMRWDNWLMTAANNLGADTIDATGVVLAVHQKHGYEHKPVITGNWLADPECRRNAELCGNKYGGAHTARWGMRGEEFVRR